jgi:hypothetical protein
MHSSASPRKPERLSPKDVIELWKTVIQTEQHFNTIEMTVRNIFATIVVALIAGIGFAVKEKIKITFFYDLPLGSLLCIAAYLITSLFYFMDRYWYHPLLLGSVIEATRLEEEISRFTSIGIKMTGRISEKSQMKLRPPFKWRAILIVSDKRLHENGILHSDGKLGLFYESIMVMFALLTIVTAPAVCPETGCF